MSALADGRPGNRQGWRLHQGSVEESKSDIVKVVASSAGDPFAVGGYLGHRRAGDASRRRREEERRRSLCAPSGQVGKPSAEESSAAGCRLEVDGKDWVGEGRD